MPLNEPPMYMNRCVVMTFNGGGMTVDHVSPGKEQIFPAGCESLISVIRVPLLVLDGELNCLFSNMSFNRTFDIDPDTIPGLSYSALDDGLLSGESLRRSLELLLSDNTDFEDLEIELDLNRLGRRSFRISSSGAVMASGNRIILLMLEDVTDTRRAETEHRDRAIKYSTLFSASRDAIMILAPPKWRFTAANPATLEMFRCRSEEEFTSLGPWDVSPPVQPDGENSGNKASRMIQKAMETGSNFFEWEHMRTDGECFPATVLLSRMELGGSLLLQATVRDMSSRRQKETESGGQMNQLEELIRSRTAELRESERMYRTLVEESRDGIYIYSGKRLRFVNDAMCDLTGYPKDSLYSMPFLDLIHSDDRARMQTYKETRETGGEPPAVYQMKMLRRDGETRIVEFSVRDITYLEQYAVLGLCRDVSDQKKREEEQSRLQKLEALIRLSGGIAHDFNNYLTGVMGNISLAKNMVQPGTELHVILSESETAAMKASRLTRQLLEFSGGVEPSRTDVSFSDLLGEAVEFALSGSNVSADLIVPEDLWQVLADQDQLGQAIRNILQTMDHAMPEGGRIEVRASNAAVDDDSREPLEAGPYVKVEILDSGPGIPEEAIRQIFDPFYKLKETEGGLGLASAYSILNRHGGHIKVENRPRGTLFTVFVPASPAGESGSGQGTESTARSGEGSILIMDDKAMVRRTASAMLKYLGFQVEAAEDGAEAVASYRDAMERGKPFDVVILDLTVPGGMGGVETLRELKSLDPGVRAMVSSGYINDPVMTEYERHGFRRAVVKPYSLGILTSLMKEMLED